MYISDIVIEEIGRTEEVNKKKRLLEVIVKYNLEIFPVTEEVVDLADKYIAKKIDYSQTGQNIYLERPTSGIYMIYVMAKVFSGENLFEKRFFPRAPLSQNFLAFFSKRTLFEKVRLEACALFPPHFPPKNFPTFKTRHESHVLLLFQSKLIWQKAGGETYARLGVCAP